MQLVPYLFFYGRCAEALEFYKAAFGGTYEMQRVAGSPAAEHLPPDAGDRVMHASFTGGGVTFMASDGRETKDVDPDEGNVSLALTATDTAEGERVFAALSEGGKVTMPLEPAFWGGRFGMVVDRFGVEWMLTLP
jgi:PhnB protein